MPAHTQAITFPNSSGLDLSARIDWPDRVPLACVVFAHCFTCGKGSSVAHRIGARLSDHGVATLRFDFTGLGDSQGDFRSTTYSGNVDDLLAAARFLSGRCRAPLLLAGHSLGGTAALSAAQHLENLAGVVTLAAPCHPDHLTRLLSSSRQTRVDGSVELSIAGRTFRVEQEFFEDISGQNLKRDIGRLGSPLLLFHSPQDRIVGIDSARHIYDTARHPKSFVSLDGSDHLLSRASDAMYVADMIVAWAARHVEALAAQPTARARTPQAPPPAHGVLVREAGSGKLAQEIAVGRHRLTSDEPIAVGGQDRGPAPYDLLLAALGSCTSMTLRLYADHKKLPLERVTVRLVHKKIAADQCPDCKTQQGKVDHIEREIEIVGDLEPAQRRRLLEIADRCPVHRTLHSEVHVVSRLLE